MKYIKIYLFASSWLLFKTLNALSVNTTVIVFTYYTITIKKIILTVHVLLRLGKLVHGYILVWS